MTNKEKLEITSKAIAEAKAELRNATRKLDFLRLLRENKDLVSKEEIQFLEKAEELLSEIDYRIDDRLFDML